MSDNEPEAPPAANPHGFIGYPTDHVYGIVDDPVTDVPQIIANLLALEVATDAIHVYCCHRGAEELSASGRGYGLRARIQRILQSISPEGQHLRIYEAELNKGHALIGVAVDGETKTPIIAAMKTQGAHDVHYYGRFTTIDH